jgi:hypothetical protein
MKTARVHAQAMLPVQLVLSAALLVLTVGCGDKSVSSRTMHKSAEEEISSSHGQPVGSSIDAVLAALRAQSEIWVPTAAQSSGGKLTLRTASDNQGREWLYLYTSERELNAAYPGGTTYAAMSFDNAFRMIADNPQFGGIFINHTSSKKYLIPRELFGRVRGRPGAT